jgi:hypothetical protein
LIDGPAEPHFADKEQAVGIREKMNENPRVAGGIVVAVVILAGIWIYSQSSSSNSSTAAAAKSAFFTEDDGQTYFPSDYANLAKDKGPNGKEMACAFVFQYGNEKPFVAWMEKYTPAGKQTLATFYSDSANAKQPPPIYATVEVLIKKPGDKAWVTMKDRIQAAMIRAVPPRSDQPAKPLFP